MRLAPLRDKCICRHAHPFVSSMAGIPAYVVSTVMPAEAGIHLACLREPSDGLPRSRE